MNAMKLLTNKWVLVIGAAVLVAAAANVSLADPPRHGGMNDGRAGYIDRGRSDGYRGGMGEARPGFIDRGRNDGYRGSMGDGRPGFIDRGRDGERGGDRRPAFGPAWQGGFGPGRGPVYAPPAFRPPVVCGGVGPVGPRVTCGTPASVGISIGPITIIIR